MSRRAPKGAAVFDAAAAALVLVDPADAGSLAELVACFDAVAGLFGTELSEDHPAAIALEGARRLATGDADAAAGLERSFAEARTAWEKASAGPGAKRGGRARGASAEGTPSRTGAGTAARGASSTPSATPLAADAELVRDFVVRATEHLDDADGHLLSLEVDPLDAEAVNGVFRAFHTIKGMAGFLALDEISAAAHEAESLLAEPRAKKTAVSETSVQALFASVDAMRSFVAAAGAGGSQSGAGASAGAGSSGAMKAAGTRVAKDAGSTEGRVVADASESRSLARPAGTRAGTVRVEEERLDRLLDAIGEMVIAESMLSASLRSGADDAARGTHLDRLDKITRELQQMATSLRMIPLRATFSRMARLVRDLAHDSGKRVELVVTGEDTELDKTVVDRISDPLVHALRNAVDHGIETPEERAAAGKPACGRVWLRAYHAGGAIHIEIADDGRGVSLDLVEARARELGLLAEDDDPGPDGLLSFLYEPGFSTARAVTDISGRGVGMDVVKRTVEELRGRIETRSEPGTGTTVEIRLPITLAIIDGMVARVGEERYIIPLLAIERSVRPAPEDVSTVTGRGEMLVTEADLIPIVRLHSRFGTPGAVTDPTEGVVVIVDDNGVRAGLMACELLGQQQTVIKPLGEGLPEQAGVAGGAIMPDGRVGLILDAAGLVRSAHSSTGGEQGCPSTRARR